MTSHDRRFIIRAKVLISTKALLAFPAGLAVPAETDFLPDFEMGHVFSLFGNATGDLVTGDERILAYPEWHSV